MKHIYLAISLFFLSSCAYVDVKVPLDTDVKDTVLGSKIGTSSSQSVLWLFAWGDAGTAAAAKEGDITTITHLDSRFYSILFGIYSKRETIAYGD